MIKKKEGYGSIVVGGLRSWIYFAVEQDQRGTIVLLRYIFMIVEKGFDDVVKVCFMSRI